jgi:hypothetical protein
VSIVTEFFTFEKLIQENLKILNSVTTVLQVGFLVFHISFHFIFIIDVLRYTLVRPLL